MYRTDRLYSPPAWPVTRWLADPGRNVPDDIRQALLGGLFGTISIFVGGVLNSVLVALIIAIRLPQAPFIAWLAFELACCLARAVVLVSARRAAAAGRPTHTDAYIVLTVLWSCSVGYGTLISVASGDWVAAILACLSAAAMVGGICFRNFSAPRLTALMICVSLGPCTTLPWFTGEHSLWIVSVQLPLYLASMTVAAYRFNRMLVATMQAERDSDRLARCDALTGLMNRFGLGFALERAVAATRRDGNEFALLYLDLDGFKSVNDTHGHAAGDRLLRDVAVRLTELAPADAAIARIGGDEFVLLVRDCDEACATALGDRIVARICEPYDLGTPRPVRIGGSVGIALVPRHGQEMTAILKAADRALYLAKSAGKSRTALAA